MQTISQQVADRNVLIGLIALQHKLIGREQLLSALTSWVSNKQRAFEEFLLERQLIDADACRHLVSMVEAHIRFAGVSASPNYLPLNSIDPKLKEEIQCLEDPDVVGSLSALESLATIAVSPESYCVDNQIDSDEQAARFKVLRPHASGGLGRVSVAFDEELHREVALKEIHDQLADHQESRDRFILEAEVTGGLEHPGIVPVYGLGKYSNGRPFYAMRFVQGNSLQEAVSTFHQDTAGLGGSRYQGLEFRQLLGRFVDVCQAIGYAHSRGVLHRDLKPGNIMLGKHGETLVVDWGLSKVVGQADSREANDMTKLHPASGSNIAPTELGSTIGTPQYMPPEQAIGNIDELSTTSDVYSLGATLYYMLVGKPPIEKADVESMIQRAAAGDIPPPRRIQPQVPRGLESVCCKAMSLNQNDRYATPEELAEEIERFLADEPLVAVAEPWVVRLQRWLRKHPTAVTSVGTSLFVGLLIGTMATVLIWQKNEELQRSNRYLVASNEVLGSVFGDLDPRESYATVGEFRTALLSNLRASRKQLEENSVAAPLEHAKIEYQLGNAFFGLSDAETAESLLRSAYVTRNKMLGPGHADSLEAARSLGAALHELGRYEEAIAIFRLALSQSGASLGSRNRLTLTIKNSLASSVYRLAGAGAARAVPLWEACVHDAQKELGDRDEVTLTAKSNLAVGYWGLVEVDPARIDDAIRTLSEVVDIAPESLGERHPQTLRAINNLALFTAVQGDLEKAIGQWQNLRRIQAENFGMDHSQTIRTSINIANASMNKLLLKPQSEQFDQSEDPAAMQNLIELLEDISEQATRALPIDHDLSMTALSNLGTGYRESGHLEQSISCLERAYDLREKRYKAQHSDTLVTVFELAKTYSKSGRDPDALKMFRKALNGSQANQFRNEYAADMTTEAIKFLDQMGELEEAKKWRAIFAEHRDGITN